MITNLGKTIIKRFYSRQVAEIANYMAIGVGSTAATINDTQLNYEVVRYPLISINPDMAGDRIVFRSSIPAAIMTQAYEVGLYSVSGGAPDKSRTINIFRTELPWTNSSYVVTNARVSPKTLKIDYVANGTTNSEVYGVSEDFSTFSDVDTLAFAFYVGSNLSSLRVRMGSDSTNYFEFAITSPVAGYNINRFVKSAATVTGSPSWANIKYIAIRPSASAAGTGSVFFDSIRMEDNTVSNQNVLVARSVLSTPYTVDPNVPNDVEYSLAISFV